MHLRHERLKPHFRYGGCNLPLADFFTCSACQKIPWNAAFSLGSFLWSGAFSSREKWQTTDSPNDTKRRHFLLGYISLLCSKHRVIALAGPFPPQRFHMRERKCYLAKKRGIFQEFSLSRNAAFYICDHFHMPVNYLLFCLVKRGGLNLDFHKTLWCTLFWRTLR